MKAEKAGALENFLGAYVEQTQTGRYHTISYLEKSRASAVPAPVILMILLVGLGTLALGETFVRYHLKRLEKRLDRILDGMTKVMDTHSPLASGFCGEGLKRAPAFPNQSAA